MDTLRIIIKLKNNRTVRVVGTLFFQGERAYVNLKDNTGYIIPIENIAHICYKPFVPDEISQS